MNAHLGAEGSPTRSSGDWWNKNFLWLLVEEIGLDALREQVVRPLAGLRDRALLRLLHRAPHRRGSATTSTRSATSTSSS